MSQKCEPMTFAGIFRTTLTAWHGRSKMLWPMRDEHPESAKPDLWGDGIVEGGLAGLWSARGWSDVSDDELVFLIPGVVRAEANSLDGAAARIRRVLDSRARSGTQVRPPAARVNRRIDAAHLTVPSAESRVSEWPTGVIVRAGADPFARLVMAELDRFHEDACLAAERRGPTTGAQAMFRSIHSGINAAYVYEDLAPLQETLAVGAWMGHLLRGRPALLPPCLAEPLADLITGSTAGLPNAAADASALLLAAHLGPDGSARLVRAAERSQRGGYPVVVDAAPFTGRSRISTEAMPTLLARRS
ncbi:hypothetical protein [Methylobacterium sp. M6A4_1b]